MKKVIAVENNLNHIKEYLANQGCYVIDAKEVERERVDAFVMSGADMNVTGVENSIAKGSPVISARGKTPEEVWQEISR